MSRNSATLDQVTKDISDYKPGTNDGLAKITQEIADLRRSDPRHFQENLHKLSENDNLTKLGFPAGYELIGMEGGKLIAANGSEKGNGEIIKLDGRTGQAEAPVNNRLTEQQIGNNGRKYQVDEAGGAYYRVGDKGAENLWNIARDYATGKNGGEKPSNNAVLMAVKELQDYNKIKNINLIHPGDMIKLPPGFDGKQWQGPLAPVKAEEPFKAPPAETQAVIAEAVKNNVIPAASAEQLLTDANVGNLIKEINVPGRVPAEQVKAVVAAAVVTGDTDTSNLTKAWNALQNPTLEQKKLLTDYGLLDGSGKPDMTTSNFMGFMSDLEGDQKFLTDPANKAFVDSLNYMKTNWGLKLHMAGNDHLDQAKFNRLLEEIKANQGILTQVIAR